MDLEVESLKMKLQKINCLVKIGKLRFLGLTCTMIALVIEHWRTVLNLILSLF